MSPATSITTSLAIAVAIAAMAFASNPDDASFKKHVEAKLKQNGRSWLERKATAHFATLLYNRQDYKLFSLIDVPEENTRFIGLFGVWWSFPMDMIRMDDDQD